MIIKSPQERDVNSGERERDPNSAAQISGPLSLDPGAPPRKPRSGLKFLVAAACVILFVLVGRFLYGIGSEVYEMARFEHRAVWQNQTIEEVIRFKSNEGNGMSTVVQPLISEDQTFDIAVTVWQLRSEEERREVQVQAAELKRQIFEGPVLDDQLMDYMGRDFLRSYTRRDKLEKAIYSDIAFRGLKLSDKNVNADIELSIPTAVFRREPMNANDLRASFVLIPSSPSLIDHLHAYSSWYPDSVMHPRFRAYPFPLNSTAQTPRTEIDRALESFAISIPLLHLAKVDCHGDSIDTGDEEEDDDVAEYRAPGPRPPEIDLDTKRKHPFVITRTQIRVVDETHLLNRKVYDKLHKKLTKTSCGQGQGPPHLHRCHQSYTENGNWETRLELKVPTEGELHILLTEDGLKAPKDGLQTQYAYAPYMASFTGHLSPKDLVRIPVTRQHCSRSIGTKATLDEEYMNITWRLSYSGRTPGKFALGEILEMDRRFHRTRTNYTMSEHQSAKEHEWSELLNGLFGHRYNEDAHPRRRFFIGLLPGFFGFLISVLEIHYWYTCSSTVSISVPGTTMSAFSDILEMCIGISRAVAKDKISGVASWAWLLSKRSLTDLLAPLLMLRAVSRIEFTNWRIHFTSASHSERTSARLDSRMSWTARLSLFFISFTLYLKFTPSDLFIIDPILPLPTEEDWPTSRLTPLIAALHVTGRISQLVLNRRAKVFAGSYKTTVWLRAFQEMTALVFFVPVIVGQYDARWGLSVGYLCELGLVGAMVWQAVSLPMRGDAEGDRGGEVIEEER